MAEIWANKFRPRDFQTLLGQELPVALMRGSILSGDVPYGYLFKGAYGSGKTSAARILAKALTCKNPLPNAEPCLVCDNCLSIETETSLNYTEVDAATWSSTDAMRSLLEDAGQSPIDSRYRVITLDECHILSKTAQSVLLKTLEEGTGQTVFCLCTTDDEKMLPAILSRVCVIHLNAVPMETVKTHLRGIFAREMVQAEPEAIELIVRETRGHMRDSLNLSQQLSYLGSVTKKSVERYLRKDVEGEVLLLIQKVLSNWEAALERIDALCSVCTPNDIWIGVIKQFLRFAIQALSPDRGGFPSNLKELLDKYFSRIGDLSEWILSSGSKYQVSTEEHLLVALLLIRNKLGVSEVEVVKVEQGPKRALGQPKDKQRENNILPTKEYLSPDEMLDNLLLEKVPNEG